MTVEIDNGKYTHKETGRELTKEEAYSLTGFQPLEKVDERTEARGVQSAERADSAEKN